jgi:predicted helicase
LNWQTLQTNEYGDWLSLRNDAFSSFIPIDPEKKFDNRSQSFFIAQSLGTATNRDAWVYNFSTSYLKENIQKTITHYNEQLEFFKAGKISQPQRDSALGNWTRDWMNQINRNIAFIEIDSEYRKALYRPFTKVNAYFADDLNQERYQLPKIFPSTEVENRVISITGLGVNKDFCTIITDKIPDLQLLANGQVFPLFYYEERQKSSPTLFDESTENEFIRRDGVSDFILERAHKMYGKNVSKEDIFYYVYGFLHSPEYRQRFANDLKKMLPRLPLVEDVRDFWSFSKAGRKLADLHINYETVPAYEGVVVTGAESGFYTVEKMRFPKKDQKDTIIYNSRITISNIPARAYEYVVNGKSAIEWIMERYQVTTHKESGIRNDPNDWAGEVGNPRYILDLVLSVINVSLQTVEIVENLPNVNFE